MNSGVLFLPGHRSSPDTHHGQRIAQLCAARGLSFTAVTYHGWGGPAAPTVPEGGEGYIRAWLSQSLRVLEDQPQEQQIIVGHSMGGYLALALAALRPARVAAVIGIAAGFGKNLCANIERLYGTLDVCTEEGERAFGLCRMNDGSLSVSAPLNIACPVRLGHASGDTTVSHQNALHIVAAIGTGDVRLHLTQDGTHGFNRPDEDKWVEEQICALALSKT